VPLVLFSSAASPPAMSRPSLAVDPALTHLRLSRCQVGAAGHPPPRVAPGSDSGSDPDLAPHAPV
jgi:hypothetical protein